MFSSHTRPQAPKVSAGHPSPQAPKVFAGHVLYSYVLFPAVDHFVVAYFVVFVAASAAPES